MNKHLVADHTLEGPCLLTSAYIKEGKSLLLRCRTGKAEHDLLRCTLPDHAHWMLRAVTWHSLQSRRRSSAYILQTPHVAPQHRVPASTLPGEGSFATGPSPRAYMVSIVSIRM